MDEYKDIKNLDFDFEEVMFRLGIMFADAMSICEDLKTARANYVQFYKDEKTSFEKIERETFRSKRKTVETVMELALDELTEKLEACERVVKGLTAMFSIRREFLEKKLAADDIDELNQEESYEETKKAIIAEIENIRFETKMLEGIKVEMEDMKKSFCLEKLTDLPERGL